jgi:drug/metabolite transporter (DMT)-like permease
MVSGAPRVSGAALLAISLWGASFVATRFVLEVFSPFALVAIRLVLGSLLLLILGRMAGYAVWSVRGGRRVWLVLGAIMAAHLLIQAVGLEYTTAIHAGWIIGFIPVVIAVGARIFLGQRLAAGAWLGVAVATFGVLLVTAQQPPDFSQARLGDLLQILSCFTWAAYTLIAIRPIERHGSLPTTAVPMAVAAVVLTVAVAVHGSPLVGEPTGAHLAALAFLGLLCSGVAYFLWFRAVGDIGPARSGSYLYLEPFVTLVVASSLLDEPVTMSAFVGGIVVLLGVWLVNRQQFTS